MALLLAISIPAFASTCTLAWKATTGSGGDAPVEVPDDYTMVVDEEAGTITTTCSGAIPLGVGFNSTRTYFDLDDMATYLCDTYGDAACDIGDPFAIGSAETGGKENYGVGYHTTDWTLMVRGKGDFTLTSNYNMQ